MKKVFILFIALTSLLLLTFGCSKDKSGENHQNKDVTDKEKGELVSDSYPLTGLPADDGVDQRIVSVMINNHPAARPQTGLSQADIIFEILSEGNITRFMALYQSETPEVVGPVRSAREYYFEIAHDYDAIYVFHGAAKFVKKMIVERDYDHLDGALYDDDQQLFKRESFRVAPHNSYLLFPAVNEVAEEKGYDLTSEFPPLSFLKKDDAVEGEAATHVRIMYPGRSSNDLVEYKYQEAEGNYTRFDQGSQTIELDSDIPIEIENVFVIETPHEVIDDEGRRAVDTESGGNALLFQQGKVQEVEWKNEDGHIIPVKDGEPVDFVKGKTWINVVPSNPGLGEIVDTSTE